MGTQHSLARATCLKTSVGRHLLRILFLLMLPDVARAQFKYTSNFKTITITGYAGPSGAITIPDTIDGLPVASIGSWAFANRTDLTNINIPNSVITITSIP